MLDYLIPLGDLNKFTIKIKNFFLKSDFELKELNQFLEKLVGKYDIKNVAAIFIKNLN
jgi:hypothetical protein